MTAKTTTADDKALEALVKLLQNPDDGIRLQAALAILHRARY